MRVSVIVPVFNAERFLEEAIRSMLAQSYTAWELLLVDDGSTDGSTAIARRHADAYPEKIRYFEHEGHQNRGAGATRNLGIANARGEYIAFLDADDVCEVTRVAKQVAFLDTHPDVAALGSWYTEINATGRRTGKMKKPCEHLEIRWALLFYCPWVLSAVMLRKEPVLEKIGGFDETLRTSQDYDLWNRISRRLGTATLPEYLVRIRYYDSSLSAVTGKAAQIGHRMRVGTVARLMGWEDDAFAANERRLVAMTQILVGTRVGRSTPEVLREAADDLFRLHAVFCATSGVSPVEEAHHRHRLRREASENLIFLALSSGSATGARTLLEQAYRVYPRILLDPRALLRAGVRAARGVLQSRRARSAADIWTREAASPAPPTGEKA